MLGYLFLAFAPGLFWLWFFVRGRSYRPNPRRLLALTFFYGMLSTIPAAILNTAFIDSDVIGGTADVAATAAAMLFVVGPVEELSKFMAVRLGPYRSLYFDEPRDGLMYATAASLGFASLENLVYIFAFGPAVMIGRAPLSTLAHVIFASFWGYALGLQRQPGSRRRPLLLLAGIAVAAVVHGVFNILVLSLQVGGILLALVLVAIGLWWTLNRFRWAHRISPFRLRRNYPQIECTGCRRRIFITSRYCQFCRLPVTPTTAISLICSHCGTPVRPDAAYCTSCGDQFIHP